MNVYECREKVGHTSMREAKKACQKHLEAARLGARVRSSMSIYKCGTCRLWHIGNNDPHRRFRSTKKRRNERVRQLILRGLEEYK